MLIYPAIDLYEGKAVRLYKGDYDKITVYSEHPEELSQKFYDAGAERIHIVDLEGARDGSTPNLDTVLKIKNKNGLFCEIGGGIRDMETVDRYIGSGIDRVILGTAAVKDEAFLLKALEKYGEKIAVGIDIKDGYVAIKGWLEKTEYKAFDFFDKMQSFGVKTVICTDISRDGAMRGSNNELYSELQKRFKLDIIASGGVSSAEDIKKLSEMRLHGAIVGKAYYIGQIDLKEAIEVAK